MFISRRNATPDLTALAQVLGYKRLPPDIDEFLDDPYYLGKSIEVFPFWREKLREIYPTPVHTSTPYLSLNCAIGSGKSTVAKVMELYLECRLDHLNDISDDTVIYKFDAPDAHVTKVLRTENISTNTIEELMNKLHDSIEKLGLSEEVKDSYNRLAYAIKND